MDLDEIIYTRFVKYFSAKRKAREQPAKHHVALVDIKPKLLIIASAFTGHAVEIFPADEEGGYKGNTFFLPATVGIFDDAKHNLLFYVFRIVYLALQKQLGHHYVQISNEDFNLHMARHLSQQNAPVVLAQMQKEYPIVFSLYQELLNLSENNRLPRIKRDELFYGKWMLFEETHPTDSSDSKYRKYKTAESTNQKTSLKAKAIEEIKSLQVDIKAQEDYVLTHNFEKVETAEEFNGTWRDFDGSDDLQSHYDAMNELKLKWTVRVDDPVHAVYQAEFMENTSVIESSEEKSEALTISYPEWNYRNRNYRENHCKVYPEVLNTTHSTYYHQTISKHHLLLLHIRKMIASYHNKLTAFKGQKDGPELDIDALTDMYVDLYSGKTPRENIYINSFKREKELGILLLIDSSLSSDGYADGNRIIDVAKEVSILFGEVLHEYNIDFSIASFHSHTRNHIQYNIAKEFHETWQSAKFKIGAIQPSGYTRIGGALRHAARTFEKSQAKNKWLILLSDGKPNDYDTYEGRYGVQDVKQSLHELKQVNVNSYAFAIEAQAKYYLPQMFGQNHYQILSSPDLLFHSLVRLFEKIKSNH